MKSCSVNCNCTCHQPLKKSVSRLPHLGRWQRWFLALKPGDRVWIQFPWSDRTQEGGRRIVATVGKTKNARIRKFNYRATDGSRSYAILREWTGDSYTKIMPVGRELRYGAKRGFYLVRDPSPRAFIRRRAAA